MKTDTIAQLLKHTETGYTNALADAIIAEALREQGLTTARLHAGKARHDLAQACVNTCALKRGAQIEATTYVKLRFADARRSYQGLAKVARDTFAEDPGALTRLGLDKPMPRRMADFATAAATLFNTGNYTKEIAATLAENGYTSARLSQERGVIGEFDAARLSQAACKGETQQAYREQKAALQALRRWYGSFKTLSREGLRANPELLEKLDILHRSVRTPAQRKAARKAADTRRQRKTSAIAAVA